MSNSQFSLDALPYVDKQIDEPGMRSLVDKLVAAEMKRMPKPQDPSALFPDIELFQTNELMQQELDRVRRGKPMEPQLDLTRYQLEPPTSTSAAGDSSLPTTGSSSSTAPTKDTVMEDATTIIPSASEELPEGQAIWHNALDNANAQLEHQNQRILNLELVQKFGNNAWNIHNYQLEYDLSMIRNAVDEKKSEIMELNKLRKRDQLDVAESLQRLEAKWAELISSTLQVEVASAGLVQELEQMKKYEAQLLQEVGDLESK
ncbi:pre-mRNA-splicing factor SPF27 [Entomortierella parvispora]|uniref:Pre-mRNA-splicing factor SPF27 n=1 Tax=Entomortierella parvispora TaxID=205924 RepID=A0A9P3LX78_9FUNG|nr:pre-mRNA-splicing factor SPF27 [Entomortierella parvispora]